MWRLFAITATASEWPIKEPKNGLAKILSIFVATNALWYSLAFKRGCMLGSVFLYTLFKSNFVSLVYSFWDLQIVYILTIMISLLEIILYYKFIK